MMNEGLYEAYFNGLLQFETDSPDFIIVNFEGVDIKLFRNDKPNDFHIRFKRAKFMEAIDIAKSHTHYITVIIPSAYLQFETLDEAKEAINNSKGRQSGIIYKAECSYETETKTEITYKKLN
jgi:hypothetical protein